MLTCSHFINKLSTGLNIWYTMLWPSYPPFLPLSTTICLFRSIVENPELRGQNGTATMAGEADGGGSTSTSGQARTEVVPRS